MSTDAIDTIAEIGTLSFNPNLQKEFDIEGCMESSGHVFLINRREIWTLFFKACVILFCIPISEEHIFKKTRLIFEGKFATNLLSSVTQTTSKISFHSD